MAFIVVGMSAAAIAMAEAAAAATLAAATTGGTLAAGAGGLGLAATAGTAGTLGTTAATLGTAAELATAAELTAAGTTGGASAVFPTGTALGQGAATGLAPGVGAGGVTAPGASSLSAAGSQTGNVFSRGLTQAGEILNNPYVQGGVAVAEGGRTYSETGDLGESFLAGLGAWGVTGGLGSLSSFAGKKLGQQAISQGSKQLIRPAINQIDNSIATGLRNPSSGQGLRGAAIETPNVGRSITNPAAQNFAGTGSGGVPQRTLLRETVNGVEITPQQAANLRATNPAYQELDAYGNAAKARLTGTPQVGTQTPSTSNLYADLGKTPTLPSGATPLPPRTIFQTPSPTGTLPVPATTPPASAGKPGMFDDFPNNYPGGTMGVLATGAIGGPMLMDAMQPSSNLRQPETKVTPYRGPYKPVERIAQFPTGPASYTDTSERQYFNDVNPYPGITEYPGAVKAAVGGLMGLAGGGSYDDEAGHDGYADGGEVEKKMATPDMSAIQEYIQGINPQREASNPLQSYLDNIGRQQQRPQVPEILRQLQAQQAAQAQTPVDSSERNYGFKPITVEKAPLAQYAPATKQKVNGMEALFGSLGMFGNANNRAFGEQAAPVPTVDEYAPYRPITMTTPGEDAHEYQYTDTSKYVYNPETQQMEIPLAMGGLTSLAKGGNYLDGPGDGLSDSIRATIGNRQPARLADGEFVISADVVSDIGGGSSKAGAKYLHAMQDRVRQRAHGTKKQVKKLDLRKVLPA